jgi:hypothetical protein
MTDLRLPLWIVTTKDAQTHPIHSPCDDPKAMHAFTAGEKMTDYLTQRTAGSWKVTLVDDRTSLILALADAHLKGSAILCVDPETDGSGGHPVTLARLMAFCNSLADRSA